MCGAYDAAGPDTLVDAAVHRDRRFAPSAARRRIRRLRSRRRDLPFEALASSRSSTACCSRRFPMDMNEIGPVLAAQGVSVCGGFLPFDCDSERESDRKWTFSSPRRYPINSRCSPLGSDQLAAGKRNSTVSTRSRSTRRQPSKAHGSAESAASSEAKNLFETCARSPETVGGLAHVRAAERRRSRDL